MGSRVRRTKKPSRRDSARRRAKAKLARFLIRLAQRTREAKEFHQHPDQVLQRHGFGAADKRAVKSRSIKKIREHLGFDDPADDPPGCLIGLFIKR